MLEPKAHQVLWFLGTFTVLWAASLVVRGLPRRSGKAGPRPASKPVLMLGSTMFPFGVAAFVAGSRLKLWVYGAGAGGADWSIFDAAGGGVIAFAFTLGAWGLLADRARGRRRCPGCWYDMADLADAGRLVCPECGRDAGSPRALLRTRPNRGLVALALAAVLVGLAMPRFGRVGRGGLKAITPTSVMVPFLFSLPDSWITNNNPDDDWTLGDRLNSSTTWGWQRRWATQSVREELDAPRSLSRLRRAVRCAPMVGLSSTATPTADRIVVVILGLASADPEERRAAFELTEVLQLTTEWGEPDPSAADAFLRAREALAARADELLPALADANPRAVMAAAEWLEASGRRDEALDVVRKLYASEALRNGVGWGTSILLRHAVRRTDLAEAIVTKAASPDYRVARLVWRRVLMEAEEAPLPPAILAAADEQLRRGEEGAAGLIANFRLRGPNASPAVLEALLEQGAASAADRARVLPLLAAGLPVKIDLRRGDRSLLDLALRDADPRVNVLACTWIAEMADARTPGFDRYEAGLTAFAAAHDGRLREAADSALAAVRRAASH